MDRLKKFAASLTAITTLATLGIGGFSVSANEQLTNVNENLLADTATAEDEFIASYAKPDEQLAANYYIENGISLEEAKSMMDIYQDGARKIAASKNSMARSNNEGVNFYSTTHLSRNQHYGIIIANNGAAHVMPTLRLSYTPNWASITADKVGVINNNFLESKVRFPNEGTIKIEGEVTPSASMYTPSGVCDIPFNVLMTEDQASDEYITFSEGNLYHQFALKKSSCDVMNGIDTTFTFETYVNGDVNHDGIVNSIDCNYLTQYVLTAIDLSKITEAYKYTDVSHEIAEIVNLRAMDTNKDGDIGAADVTGIMKTLE